MTAQDLPRLLGCVAPELERVEAWIQAELQAAEPVLAPLLEHAARFRGKRLRAAQVLLVGRACGGLGEAHVVLAGIVELIHAATLIHDDLLDGADQRRRLSCVHVEWGSHAAVLLGDWFYARAFLRSTAMPDGECSRVLAEASGRICLGEIHQNLTREDFWLAEEDYLRQIDGKTAALYEAGGRLAAHYAGAAAREQAACARHGLLAGRAFQIVDDLLDLVGEEDRAGKSLGTDWERGKMTLPLIRLREALETPQREELAALFGSGADRAVLRERFGAPLERALAVCRAEVRSLLEEAIRALAPLPAGEAREVLRTLTLFLGERRS